MGVLQELQRKGLVREVARGGFVSPFGYSCVGGPYGSVSKCRTFAIKRMICDEAIAMRAREVGANLIEETEVFSCNFDANRGFWTLKTSDKRIFCCRMLVLADGSNSRLAHTLNIVTEQPTAICTRHYIESDTHDCTDDGVMFYTPSVLPGYSAIFRHYNNDLYLGTYLLPGSKVEHRHLSRLEAEIVTSYDPVRKALGKSFKWKDLMKTAPLRIGGVDKSYADNLIIVGDAAGQVDPMTGEGIHTAMVAAKIAANLIQEMFLSDNFSSQNCAIYHQRWMKNFGSDFVYSKWIAKAVVYFPFIMDALCVVGIRRGQAFLDEFGLIMTGVKPKLEFLRPKYVFPIGVEIIRQIFIQKILRRPPITPDYARSVLRRNKKARN
uniref:Geranylgeranyl reductase n=1 Tax=Hirondellea gigas TaxID=1518452 RepID=A0A6A7G5B6_9CRUS